MHNLMITNLRTIPSGARKGLGTHPPPPLHSDLALLTLAPFGNMTQILPIQLMLCHTR
jgi:hypothetical protein